MPLVFACIAPHGGGIIPGQERDAAGRWARTRAAMAETGRRFRATRPDAAVVLTPHGAAVTGALAVSLGERATGRLDGGPPAQLGLDRRLGQRLTARAAAAGLPVRGLEHLALDWGVLVPLQYLSPCGALVVVATSPDVPRLALVEFGRLTAATLAEDGRRVALVASADLAHAHDARGPYGFDPAAATFDRRTVAAVGAGEPERLLDIDAALVERAKPDALPQLLVLAGALRRVAARGRPLRGELLSYEVPTYFGMLCAAYA